jgi:parallel beta-helix repeat protein
MKRVTAAAVILVLLLPVLAGVFSVKLIVAASEGQEENTWVTMEPMPSTGGSEAAVVNGKIYVFGGSVTYEYNPAVDAWAVKTPMPTSRSSFAVAASGGKIYVIGGSVSGTSVGLNEVYDPETDTWETRTAMPTNRSQIEVNAVNGRIYVTGGRTAGPYSTVDATEEYDVATDSWSTKSPMPYPVVSSVSAVVDSKIYVIGGQDEFEEDMNLKVVQIFNPAVNDWTLGQSAPAVVWQASAGATTGAMATKRIYVIGGMEGFAEPLDSNYAYDPEADAWSSAAAVPTARYGPTCAVVNDQLYVIGGGIGFPLGTTANERYTPIGYGSLLPPEPLDTVTVPDDSPTIQAAIDIVKAGGTVFVKSGIYYDQSLTILKPLSLVGENAETTILAGKSTSPSTIINVISSGVRICNFILENAQTGIAITGNEIQVCNNKFTGCATAIQLNGDHNNISENLITASSQGIALDGSYNRVVGNEITQFGSLGIVMKNADYNIISNNKVTEGNEGIKLGSGGTDCSHNSVSGNVVEKIRLWGILMASGSYNVFSGNNITDNKWSHDGYGVAIGGNHLVAEYNTFYQNNFKNNSKNVGYNWNLEGAGNNWDNGTLGNYWDDYTGADDNGDGIGDTHYVIDANNIDKYPLMKPANLADPTPDSPELPSPFPTPTPSSSPTQDSSLTPEPEQTQPTSPAPSPAPQETTRPQETENLPLFPTTLIAGLFLVSAVAVSAGFMFYFKKRKR